MTQEHPTSKASFSLNASGDASKLAQQLAAIPISKNDGAPLRKLHSTVSRKMAASTARGNSASSQSTQEDLSDSDNFSSQFMPAHRSLKRPRLTHRRMSGTIEASNTTVSSSKHPNHGARYAASFSKARPALASRRSSSTRSSPETFTLWQSKHLFGSTATSDSVFYSLTSIKAVLCAKNSSDCWMAIATQLSSKAASRALDGIALCLHPTTPSPYGATQQSDDGSSSEDTSGSQASEDNTHNFNTSSEQESEESTDEE